MLSVIKKKRHSFGGIYCSLVEVANKPNLKIVLMAVAPILSFDDDYCTFFFLLSERPSEPMFSIKIFKIRSCKIGLYSVDFSGHVSWMRGGRMINTRDPFLVSC